VIASPFDVSLFFTYTNIREYIEENIRKPAMLTTGFMVIKKMMIQMAKTILAFIIITG
jgi:hypothetical protein